MIVVFADWLVFQSRGFVKERIRNRVQEAVGEIASKFRLHTVILVDQMHEQRWQHNHLQFEITDNALGIVIAPSELINDLLDSRAQKLFESSVEKVSVEIAK